MTTSLYTFSRHHLQLNKHGVKSVRIRSYSGPYFPAFGTDTKRYGEIQIGEIRTRITSNTDNFYAAKMTAHNVAEIFNTVRIQTSVRIHSAGVKT